MKTLFTFILSTLLLQAAHGQVLGKFTGAGGLPASYTNVSLLKSKDSTTLQSVQTDDGGAFKFNQVTPGSYLVKAGSMIYQYWTSPVFDLSAGRVKDLGTVQLSAASKQLGEVIIRADKPAVQQQAGGLVINVQNSIMTKGSSALQVLERSPGVMIDPRNNNISLNGKSGVMVMMDGKLMRMSMAQVVSLLSGLSADNIDKVELLTTPPANYDADGNAGIINIVTKKNKRTGTNGSYTLTAGYGKGEKASAAFNINHNTGKTNWYGSYSYAHDRTYGLLFAGGTENVGAVGGQAVFEYWGESKPVSNYHNAIAGVDYNIDPKTTVGASINYTNTLDYSHHYNHGAYRLKPDSVLLFSSTIGGTGRGQNTTGSIYAERKLGSDEKINFDADYIYYTNNGNTAVQSSFIDNYGNPVGQNDSLYAPMQRNLSDSRIQVGVATIDYGKQLGKKWKLETGVKGTYTRSSGSAGIENFENGQWVSNLSATSNLITKEKIGAVYASFNIQPDTATSVIIGGRYEYSDNRTNSAAGGADVAVRTLGKLFPNIFVSRKLNVNSELQLSYTTRISRPSYADLASYINYNDPVSVFTGNPLLKPTITSNLKLGYNYHDYTFSLLYSHDANPIAQGQVTTGPSKQLVYIRPENVTYQNNLTLQTNLPFKINNWWQMNYNLTGGWRKFKIDYTLVPVVKSYYNYSLNFTQSFKLTPGFSFELSGYYNSLNYYGMSEVKGLGSINAGIKKELKNNGGSFQLSVTDILRSTVYNSYIGTLTQDAFSSDVHIIYNSEASRMPVIRLSYFKSFGSGTNKRTKQDNGSKDERDRI